MRNGELSDKHKDRKYELWKTRGFRTYALLFVIGELARSCSSPIGIEIFLDGSHVLVLRV